jgi:hypothetical protein
VFTLSLSRHQQTCRSRSLSRRRAPSPPPARLVDRLAACLLSYCSCTEPGSVDQSDLADTPPVQFIAGVAGDLQIADERAISMATNWVAGHCRSRIVEVGVGLQVLWQGWGQRMGQG